MTYQNDYRSNVIKNHDGRISLENVMIRSTGTDADSDNIIYMDSWTFKLLFLDS